MILNLGIIVKLLVSRNEWIFTLIIIVSYLNEMTRVVNTSAFFQICLFYSFYCYSSMSCNKIWGNKRDEEWSVKSSSNLFQLSLLLSLGFFLSRCQMEFFFRGRDLLSCSVRRLTQSDDSVFGEDDGTSHLITVDLYAGLILQQKYCAGYSTCLNWNPHEDNNGVKATEVLLKYVHFIYLLAVN